MTARQHFLRTYSAPPVTIPMIYADEIRSGRFADETNWWSTKPDSLGCSVCRDSELHCLTPVACGRAEISDPLPLFANSPLASKAIGCALFLGFCVGLYVAVFR